MLFIRTDFWPLFYTDRLKAIALAGVCPVDLGPSYAVNEGFKPGIDEIKPTALKQRQEPILITRVAYTIYSEILPEDVPLCGYLSVAAFEQNLQLQKPSLTPADPVTFIYFRRHRELS